MPLSDQEYYATPTAYNRSRKLRMRRDPFEDRPALNRLPAAADPSRAHLKRAVKSPQRPAALRWDPHYNDRHEVVHGRKPRAALPAPPPARLAAPPSYIEPTVCPSEVIPSVTVSSYDPHTHFACHAEPAVHRTFQRVFVDRPELHDPCYRPEPRSIVTCSPEGPMMPTYGPPPPHAVPTEFAPHHHMLPHHVHSAYPVLPPYHHRHMDMAPMLPPPDHQLAHPPTLHHPRDGLRVVSEPLVECLERSGRVVTPCRTDEDSVAVVRAPRRHAPHSVVQTMQVAPHHHHHHSVSESFVDHLGHVVDVIPHPSGCPQGPQVVRREGRFGGIHNVPPGTIAVHHPGMPCAVSPPPRCFDGPALHHGGPKVVTRESVLAGGPVLRERLASSPTVGPTVITRESLPSGHPPVAVVHEAVEPRRRALSLDGPMSCDYQPDYQPGRRQYHAPNGHVIDYDEPPVMTTKVYRGSPPPEVADFVSISAQLGISGPRNPEEYYRPVHPREAASDLPPPGSFRSAEGTSYRRYAAGSELPPPNGSSYGAYLDDSQQPSGRSAYLDDTQPIGRSTVLQSTVRDAQEVVPESPVSTEASRLYYHSREANTSQSTAAPPPPASLTQSPNSNGKGRIVTRESQPAAAEAAGSSEDIVCS